MVKNYLTKCMVWFGVLTQMQLSDDVQPFWVEFDHSVHDGVASGVVTDDKE